MKQVITRSKGFTLMELMITIAIIGIIAAIAIPSYLNYTKKAYFTEIVRATAPYKVGVGECYHKLGTLVGCTSGTNGVPPAITAPGVGGITSLAVANGVITVTPVADHGILATDLYVLTPTVTSEIMTWASSGAGVTKGYAP